MAYRNDEAGATQSGMTGSSVAASGRGGGGISIRVVSRDTLIVHEFTNNFSCFT